MKKKNFFNRDLSYVELIVIGNIAAFIQRFIFTGFIIEMIVLATLISGYVKFFRSKNLNKFLSGILGIISWIITAGFWAVISGSV